MTGPPSGGHGRGGRAWPRRASRWPYPTIERCNRCPSRSLIYAPLAAGCPIDRDVVAVRCTLCGWYGYLARRPKPPEENP